MNKKLANIELRSEEVQDILTKVPNWMIRWGSLLFLLLIIMVLTLSWFIKYPDILQSQAYLTTQLTPQKVYSRVTGRIDSIFVSPNEMVTIGEKLALLENTANFKDIQLLSKIIDTITISKDIFNFPIDKIPLLFLGEIESDYSNFETNYIDYTINRDLKPYSNEATAQHFALSELRLRLNNLKSQIAINKREMHYKEKDLERNKTLFEKGVIAAMEFENKQIDYLQAKRNYENLENSESQIREAISAMQMNSNGTSINKTRDDLTLLKKVFQSYNQLKKSIKDWENKYLLKSEITGKVSFFNYWSKNQTVNQGEVIFTVIPHNNKRYIAKLRAPSRNAGKIKINQRVNIKLANYPDIEFGTLKGKVDNISQIPDKDGFYLIDVKLPNKLITSYNKEIKFQPEMSGVAEIVTEDLRLLERFFYQLRDLSKK